jgi:glycosyltransferase involved in cell wall biosynthesis
MLLSLVVPVYNEEAVLPVFLGELNEVLAQLDCGHEIVFVNDGSVDGTGDFLDRAAAEDPRIKVVASPATSDIRRRSPPGSTWPPVTPSSSWTPICRTRLNSCGTWWITIEQAIRSCPLNACAVRATAGRNVPWRRRSTG